MIGGSTRLVALLGQPVAGSLSPRMQNAAFAARALDWAYLACEVAPEGLAAAVGGLVALGFGGANVTAPHKEAAAELCDEAEGPAVNTLVLRIRFRPEATFTELLEEVRQTALEAYRHQAAPFETMQGGIERPGGHGEHVTGDELQPAHDVPAVERLRLEQPQDQQLERALQQFGRLVLRHSYCWTIGVLL